MRRLSAVHGAVSKQSGQRGLQFVGSKSLAGSVDFITDPIYFFAKGVGREISFVDKFGVQVEAHGGSNGFANGCFSLLCVGCGSLTCNKDIRKSSPKRQIVGYKQFTGLNREYLPTRKEKFTNP